MNLNKTIKSQLVSDVLRDQFGKEIEKEIDFIRVKTCELSQSLHGDATQKIMEIAKGAGMQNDMPLRDTAELDNFSSVAFRSNSCTEYKSSGRVSLDKSVVCKYSYWLSPNDEILNAQNRLLEIQLKWNTLKSDLNQVLDSVRTVKKLKELTSVFNPFIPSQIAGTQIIPVDPLLRINELKSPKSNL